MGLSIKADTVLVTPRINRKTKIDFVPSPKAIEENEETSVKIYFLSRQESVQSLKLNWKFDGPFCFDLCCTQL